jgi:thiol-disulfide isomerase/thioredoxin
MRGIYFAGCVLLFVGVAGGFSDEPTDAPVKTVAQELAAIKKRFAAEEQDLLNKQLAKARAREDQSPIVLLRKELHTAIAAAAVELAMKNPTDEAAVDSAVFALDLLVKLKLFGHEWDKAVKFFLDNYVDNLKIQGALAQVSEAGLIGQSILKSVFEKTTNKNVKGLAMYYGVVLLGAEASSQESKGNDLQAKQIREGALRMLAGAVELAPDAKIGEQSFAEAAAAELFSLNIGVGSPLPDLEGLDLEGKKIEFSSLRGRVVLLDFWAIGCPPCVQMIPHERDMVERMSKRPFTLLSVNLDEEKSTLTEFLKKQKMPWTHWWDGGTKGPLAKAFKVRGFPTLFLIDARGVVRKKWFGAPSDKVLDKAVAELVAEAEKEKP